MSFRFGEEWLSTFQRFLHHPLRFCCSIFLREDQSPGSWFETETRVLLSGAGKSSLSYVRSRQFPPDLTGSGGWRRLGIFAGIAVSCFILQVLFFGLCVPLCACSQNVSLRGGSRFNSVMVGGDFRHPVSVPFLLRAFSYPPVVLATP